MKPDWQILAELAVFLNLESHEEDVAGEAFDRLGLPYPGGQANSQHVRQLVLDLERRHEAGELIREYHEDEIGLLYYKPAAGDADMDTRIEASARTVQEIARGISADFVRPEPWG